MLTKRAPSPAALLASVLRRCRFSSPWRRRDHARGAPAFPLASRDRLLLRRRSARGRAPQPTTGLSLRPFATLEAGPAPRQQRARPNTLGGRRDHGEKPVFRLSHSRTRRPFQRWGSVHRPPGRAKRHCSRAAFRKWGAVRDVNPYSARDRYLQALFYFGR